MKHLNEFNIFKNKEKELGDKVVSRILEITKEENITIQHTGGFQIEIDDKIYSFSSYSSIVGSDCQLGVYNKSQKVTTAKYGEIISGDSVSRYKFSKKLWNKLEKLYKEQQTNQNDLEELSDVNRAANKYNL